MSNHMAAIVFKKDFEKDLKAIDLIQLELKHQNDNLGPQISRLIEI